MIQEIAQIRKIDNLHIDPLVSYHLQFHVIELKILVFVIVFVMKKSNLIEIH